MTWVLYNEAGNVGLYLFGAGYFFMVLFVSILWHEIGHLKVLGKGKKMYFNGLTFYAGEESDYHHLPNEKYLQVVFAGVVFGLVPIIAVYFANTSPLPIQWVILPYLVGCRDDLKVLFKSMNTDTLFDMEEEHEDENP